MSFGRTGVTWCHVSCFTVCASLSTLHTLQDRAVGAGLSRESCLLFLSTWRSVEWQPCFGTQQWRSQTENQHFHEVQAGIQGDICESTLGTQTPQGRPSRHGADQGGCREGSCEKTPLWGGSGMVATVRTPSNRGRLRRASFSYQTHVPSLCALPPPPPTDIYSPHLRNLSSAVLHLWFHILSPCQLPGWLLPHSYPPPPPTLYIRL